MSVQEYNQALDQSLILYLREDVFPTRGWTINIANELTQPYLNGETGEYERGKFQAQYKNWVYYSSGVSGVTVPATVSPSTGFEYFDYINGVVSFSGTIPATPPQVTYSYNVVSVIDGFPDVDNPESFQLPCVSVDLVNTSRKPAGLGGGFFVTRTFNLDVFANNDSEADQVTQAIQDGVAYRIPILNFEVTDYPLNENGDRKSTYTKATPGTSGVRVEARVLDLNVKTIRVPMAIGKFRYRRQVTIETEITE